MNNIVSIWLGRVESEEKLNIYVAEHYDDEGNSICAFYSDFQIEGLDSDFREVAFQELLNKSLLANVSYGESFIDKLDADFSKYNAIILAYDYTYAGTIQSAGDFNFYAALPYQKP